MGIGVRRFVAEQDHRVQVGDAGHRGTPRDAPVQVGAVQPRPQPGGHQAADIRDHRSEGGRHPIERALAADAAVAAQATVIGRFGHDYIAASRRPGDNCFPARQGAAQRRRWAPGRNPIQPWAKCDECEGMRWASPGKGKIECAWRHGTVALGPWALPIGFARWASTGQAQPLARELR